MTLEVVTAMASNNIVLDIVRGRGRGCGRCEGCRQLVVVLSICVCGCARGAPLPLPQGLNFGITKLVLDLVVLYCNMMLLLSTIDDRRALVALYNHAFDLNRGSGWVLGPASDWLDRVM